MSYSELAQLELMDDKITCHFFQLSQKMQRFIKC